MERKSTRICCHVGQGVLLVDADGVISGLILGLPTKREIWQRYFYKLMLWF